MLIVHPSVRLSPDTGAYLSFMPWRMSSSSTSRLTKWRTLSSSFSSHWALMTSVMDNAAKVSGYVEECKKMGIQLLPPDINEGYKQFSVSDGKIRSVSVNE